MKKNNFSLLIWKIRLAIFITMLASGVYALQDDGVYHSGDNTPTDDVPNYSGTYDYFRCDQDGNATLHDGDTNLVLWLQVYKGDVNGVVTKLWDGATAHWLAHSWSHNDSGGSTYDYYKVEIDTSTIQWYSGLTIYYKIQYHDGVTYHYAVLPTGHGNNNEGQEYYNWDGGNSYSFTIADDDTTGPSNFNFNVDGQTYHTNDLAGGLAVTGQVRDAESGVATGSSNTYTLARGGSYVTNGTFSVTPANGGAKASAENISVTIPASAVQTPGSYTLYVTNVNYDIDSAGDRESGSASYTFTVNQASVEDHYVTPGSIYPWTRPGVAFRIFPATQWSDIDTNNTFIKYTYDNGTTWATSTVVDAGWHATNVWRAKGLIPAPGRNATDVDFTYAGEGTDGQAWRNEPGDDYDMPFDANLNDIQYNPTGSYHSATGIVNGQSYAYVTKLGETTSKTNFTDGETAVIRAREYKDDTEGIVLRYRGNWDGTLMSDASIDYNDDSDYFNAFTVAFMTIQVSGENWNEAITNNAGVFDYNFKYYDGIDYDCLKASGMQGIFTGGTDFSLTVTDDDTTGPVHSSCNVDGQSYLTTENGLGLAVSLSVQDTDSGVLAGNNSTYALTRDSSPIDSGNLTPDFSDGGAKASTGGLTVTIAAGHVQTVGSYALTVTSIDADNDRTGDSTSNDTVFNFTVAEAGGTVFKFR